jgi:hypothetical protein
VRGVPWWAAVVIALIGSAAGFAIDFNRVNAVSVFAWTLTILGMLLAGLLVRRHAVFTAMVQPPLVVVFGLLIGYLIAVNSGVLSLGLKLASAFPLMLAATAVGLIIGMLRIISQPLRRVRPRAAAARDRSHV